MNYPRGGYAPKNDGTKPAAPPSDLAGVGSASGSRAREHIAALATEMRGALTDDGGDDGSPATMFMSGAINGLVMAVRILGGATGEQALESVETALATVVGRMYLTGQMGASAAPKTPDPLPPYIDVKEYRTDDGRKSWVFRCWGDGDCDGALHLDLGNQPYAERKAREHVAQAHAATKEN
jgi:hypothetical protein